MEDEELELASLRRERGRFVKLQDRLNRLQQNLQNSQLIMVPAGSEFVPFEIISVELFKDISYLVALERDTGDIVCQILREGGNWTSHEMRLVLEHVTENSKVLDLGAHIGSFALPCAVLGAQVVAVDGSAKSAALLSLSGRLNKLTNLQVIEGVVWSKAQSLFLQDTGSSGCLSFEPQAHSKSRPVAADTLPNILKSARLTTFDVIKLDIEGAEVDALSQASYLFAGDLNPLVIIESNGYCLNRFGRTVQDLLKCLEGLGLKIYRYDGGELVSVDSNSLQIEVCVDYLAARQLPDYLARVRRCPYFTTEELAVMAYGWTSHFQPEQRAHLARTLLASPAAMREHSAVRAALSRLSADPVLEVREVFSAFRAES